MIYDATISSSVTLYFDAIRFSKKRFYVHKCETLTSQPRLVANILIRKLSMLQ